MYPLVCGGVLGHLAVVLYLTAREMYIMTTTTCHEIEDYLLVIADYPNDDSDDDSLLLI